MIHLGNWRALTPAGGGRNVGLSVDYLLVTPTLIACTGK